MTLVWVAQRSDKCGDSVVKLEENLAQVCGSFSWSVVPKYVVFAELETGGGGGDRGGWEGFGWWGGAAGKTLGERVSENNCEY